MLTVAKTVFLTRTVYKASGSPRLIAKFFYLQEQGEQEWLSLQQRERERPSFGVELRQRLRQGAASSQDRSCGPGGSSGHSACHSSVRGRAEESPCYQQGERTPEGRRAGSSQKDGLGSVPRKSAGAPRQQGCGDRQADNGSQSEEGHCRPPSSCTDPCPRSGSVLGGSKAKGEESVVKVTKTPHGRIGTTARKQKRRKAFVQEAASQGAASLQEPQIASQGGAAIPQQEARDKASQGDGTASHAAASSCGRVATITSACQGKSTGQGGAVALQVTQEVPADAGSEAKPLRPPTVEHGQVQVRNPNSPRGGAPGLADGLGVRPTEESCSRTSNPLPRVASEHALSEAEGLQGNGTFLDVQQRTPVRRNRDERWSPLPLRPHELESRTPGYRCEAQSPRLGDARGASPPATPRRQRQKGEEGQMAEATLTPIKSVDDCKMGRPRVQVAPEANAGEIVKGQLVPHGYHAGSSDVVSSKVRFFESMTAGSRPERADGRPVTCVAEGRNSIPSAVTSESPLGLAGSGDNEEQVAPAVPRLLGGDNEQEAQAKQVATALHNPVVGVSVAQVVDLAEQGDALGKAGVDGVGKEQVAPATQSMHYVGSGPETQEEQVAPTADEGASEPAEARLAFAENIRGMNTEDLICMGDCLERVFGQGNHEQGHEQQLAVKEELARRLAPPTETHAKLSWADVTEAEDEAEPAIFPPLVAARAKKLKKPKRPG